MGTRELFRGLIIDEETLTDLIPEARWKSSGSMSEDNAPPRPFGVIRYGLTTPGMGEVKRGTVTIWIHDELGDYGLINSVLERLYGTLNGREHVADGEGNELVLVEWQNDSGDLYDPGYKTITRNTTFNLIGKGV
jgi:hypothetical protein